MGRAYLDEDEECGSQWAIICWAGAVASAIRGKRGQAFLREMKAAMEALPKKELIADELMLGGEVCAIGAVGLARNIEMQRLDTEDHYTLARVFNISETLVREIMFANDKGNSPWRHNETPSQRYQRVMRWIDEQLKPLTEGG